VIGDVEDEDAAEDEEDIWDRSIIEDLAEILMNWDIVCAEKIVLILMALTS
jgi:hypothetical protein